MNVVLKYVEFFWLVDLYSLAPMFGFSALPTNCLDGSGFKKPTVEELNL